MRLMLGAIVGASIAIGTSACIPWTRITYNLAPAFAGAIRSSDGAPAAGVQLLVSSTSDCSRPIARTVTDSAGRFDIARSERSMHWLPLVPVDAPRTAYALCAGPRDSLRVVESGYLSARPNAPQPPAEALSCRTYEWEHHTVVACRDTAEMR